MPNSGTSCEERKGHHSSEGEWKQAGKAIHLRCNVIEYWRSSETVLMGMGVWHWAWLFNLSFILSQKADLHITWLGFNPKDRSWATSH